MHSSCPVELLTPALDEQVSGILEHVDPEGKERLLDKWLLPVCAVSPYLAHTCRRYPDALVRLLESGALLPEVVPPSVEQLIAEVSQDLEALLADAASGSADSKQLDGLQQRALRQFRHRHMVRILWRDLTQTCSVDVTMQDLSSLADACVRAADDWSYKVLLERFGKPLSKQGLAQRLIVLGMGKLGGFELNVSSDIDLIFVWAEAGRTDGDSHGLRSIDNGEFFRRLAQRLILLLNSVTEDGFVYRVDTRLRPFGESGPLVMNFEGLENYYLTQARDWERYAMIKARPLTGNVADIRELGNLIEPFVYRRYLDYNAFDSLRDLKRKIALSLVKKGLVDNIKLGSGGIREVEFLGQAFQLVRGGRDARLRLRPIVEVLQQLAAQQLLPVQEVNELLAAYRYLRRVENGVQMMRDEQVHSLPIDAEDRLRLVTILDEPDWTRFREQLGKHQRRVSESFAALFANDSGDLSAESIDSTQAAETWAVLSAAELDRDIGTEALQQFGISATDELMTAISSVCHSAFYQRLTARAQERVDRIIPQILLLARDAPAPSETLKRCLALVRAVAGRSGYLQVLIDQPAALSRLVSLFAQSQWVANFVLRQPIVIDELLDDTRSEINPDLESLRAETRSQTERLLDSELDEQMDSLRHYRQARELRIACAELDGSLTLMQASDQLTWLAETLIEAVLTLVEKPLVAKHGKPTCREGGIVRPARIGIVAYGKLGGIELGFGSDLDLVFLHDSRAEVQQTDGDRVIDNSVFYARLAQKFVHFMSTTTPAGVLYDIDLRLRPNGSSGLLVTGIDAFARYQEGDAWTWEHQALMRARMVLSNATLKERFDEIRAAVLAQPRSADELREAVARMRERMRSALGSTKPGSMHLKQDAGGVADIEFVVQYLVLAHAAEHPSLLCFTDNVRVLEEVGRLELLPPADTELLTTGYLALRARLHRQALQEAGAVVQLDDELSSLRDAIEELRIRVLGAW